MSLRIPKSALILLGVAAILFFVLITIILFSLFNKDASPSQIQQPTPTSILQRIRSGNSPVKAEKILPTENTSGNSIKNPSQQITFTTSQNITPQNIRVTVSPSLPVKIEQGANPNEILVFPDPPEFWKPDILYTISLFDNSNKLITKYEIKVPKFTVPYDPL